MSGAEKAEALDKVASSGLPKRRALGELGVPKSAYYRWLSSGRSNKDLRTTWEAAIPHGTSWLPRR